MALNHAIKRRQQFFWIIALSTLIILTPNISRAGYTELSTKYLAALSKGDDLTMHELVVKHKEYIPAELKALIDAARESEATKEARDESFFIAESMARVYMETTGDTSQLKAVKGAIFDSKLNAPVRTEAKSGMHTIITPKATDHAINIFQPNNLIIQKGESVTWVNNDSVAHLFSSMPFIGKTGIRSPEVAPGGSFTFKFDKAGVYYYICYIHRSMLGKITVEGIEEPEPVVVKEEPKKPEPIKGEWERGSQKSKEQPKEMQKDQPKSKTR